MLILIPITITAAMLTSCSVAEPAATETAWVSAGTYAVGDKRIRTGTHREYKCKVAHTGRTALPEDDTDYWTDYGPTVKWAAYDQYVSTPQVLASPLANVVEPGFADTITMYGLVGTEVVIVHKDAPGGTTLETRTISLYADAIGAYEYMFDPAEQKTEIIETGFELTAAPEFTITVTGSGTVEVGMINLGMLRDIVGLWGGTQYGSSVEPVSASRIKTDPDTLRVSIVRGTAATNMRISVALEPEDANYALKSVQRVLDVPASFIGSTAENYEGLNVFGLGSFSLSYDSYGAVNLKGYVKGMF